MEKWVSIKEENQNSNKSKYSINESFFEKDKQTHNSAYILGMLASDGCVSKAENCIYIELQRKDKAILEEINKVLKNERPVKDYHNNSKNYDNSKLYFFSKKIKQDLSLYDIVPNKTHNLGNFMNNLDARYYIDFIRGFFDGDGCIKWVNGTIEWQIDSTSKDTLLTIQEILKSYGIITKIVLHSEINKKRNKTIDLYRIYCYGKKNAIEIYKIFYEYPEEETLRMKRKQDHFLELLMKYKTQETSVLK